MTTLGMGGRILAMIGIVSALTLPVQAKDRWISAWGTAQQLAPLPPPPQLPRDPKTGKPLIPPPPLPSPIPPTPTEIENQTIRMIVRPSIGGGTLRLQFSNASGGAPLTIGRARLAKSTGGARIDSATDRAVSFGGLAAVTIQPGTVVTSDAISLNVTPRELLAVSIYLPGKVAVNTLHPLGLRTTFMTSGDSVAVPDLARASTNRSYFWLSGLQVLAPEDAGTIVAFGDSITDGFTTTPDAGRAWPELLAQRLQADPRTRRLSVINMGIAGNRLRRDGAGLAGLARFDRDVLGRPGVRWVILLEGINDINIPAIPGVAASEAVTAQDLIQAYSQFVDRAHLHGIRVMGATITPTEGLWLFNEKTEALRQAVNQWIRTSGKFDAVVDFDAAIRDPNRPTRLNPRFDPGDNIHPNDAGNKAMAEAIETAHFLVR